jgi:murein DD-endopeptidase MepM/ murein hydrolase activator NlpD
MGEIIDLRRGLAAAASLSVIAGFLAACSPGPSEPVPVYLHGAAQTAAKAPPPPQPWRDNTIFTVRQGDTVIDIAHDYHVPLGALIAANKLRSPYLIHPGDQMLIPDGGVPTGDMLTARQAMAASTVTSPAVPSQMAAIPPRPAPATPQIATAATPVAAPIATASPPPASAQITATPPPSAPAQIAATSPPPAAPSQVAITPLTPPSASTATQIAAITPHPPPLPQMPGTQQHPTAPVQAVTAQLQPAPTQVVAATTPIPPSSQIAAAAMPAPSPTPTKIATDTVPLDPPSKPVAAAQSAPPPPPPPAATTGNGLPSVLAARNPAAALPLPGEPPPTIAIGSSTGRFLWPVHGRVLASYGLSTSEAHNQGINIAAPLGTPVRSIDAGTVAYVGNEVKGYGNLVLIKHANGWISAYANLNDVTVKKGDTVSAGEVIAKVGDTGVVGEPQLHFELRRGKKPVDPKEFLEPAGSAAAKAAQKAG